MRVRACVLTVAVSLVLSLPGRGSAQADSAGVRVVTNPAPRPNGPAFKLSARPLASIGTVEGAPAYQLFRANQAYVLSDGRIVIGNQGTQEIRFYDKTGKYLSTAGKKGEGPGEFTSLGLVAVFADDSLVTSDIQVKRFQVFDKTGKYVRSFQAPKEIGLIYVTPGVLANGKFVELNGFIGPGHEANGRLRLPQTLSLMAGDGSSVQTLGEFPGAEASVSPTATAGVMFGRSIHAEARGNRIAVANDDAYSIRIYDGSGKLLQIVRQTRQPVAVKSGDYERGLPPFMLPGAPENQNRIAQMMKPLYEQMYRYTTFPAFGGQGNQTTSLRFDAAGNLWVQEYQPSWERNTSWQAFDPSGKLIGRLDLPEKTTLLDVAPDWVLVKVTDELDVEHVVLYGLERPGR